MPTELKLKDDVTYVAENCFHYSDITTDKDIVIARKIAEKYILSRSSLMPEPSSEEAGNDLLLSIWRKEGLLIGKERALLSSLQKVTKGEFKQSLIHLFEKLKEEALLGIEQKALFKKNITYFTQFKNTTVFDVVLSKENLPTGIESISRGVKLLASYGFDVEKIQENIDTKFLDDVSKDLERINSEHSKCEIIIVDDKWQNDPEIHRGIAMRDKAHNKHNHSALIITERELGLLASQGIRFDLTNVYKISTLRHTGGDFDVLAQQIGDLTAACSKQASCSLKEIVLRECFSAGSRDKQELIFPEPSPLHAASSDVDESHTSVDLEITNPGMVANSDCVSDEESQKNIENIFKPSHGLTAAEWARFKTQYTLLQTRGVVSQRDEETVVDNSVALNKLKMILRENPDISTNIPHLIIKGYYGYVTPYALSDELGEHVMRPVDRRANSVSKASPELLYKAVRVPVFDTEEDVQHIKRGRAT